MPPKREKPNTEEPPGSTFTAKDLLPWLALILAVLGAVYEHAVLKTRVELMKETVDKIDPDRIEVMQEELDQLSPEQILTLQNSVTCLEQGKRLVQGNLCEALRAAP